MKISIAIWGNVLAAIACAIAMGLAVRGHETGLAAATAFFCGANLIIVLFYLLAKDDL